jgi:hypothetical protein
VHCTTATLDAAPTAVQASLEPVLPALCLISLHMVVNSDLRLALKTG